MSVKTVHVIGAHPAHNVGGTTASLLAADGSWEVMTPTEAKFDARYVSNSAAGYSFRGEALVYCAGVCDPAWIRDTPPADIFRQIDITLSGAIACVAQFVAQNQWRRATTEDDTRRIVIIGSAAADTPHRGQAPYNAAKAGLRAAVATIAREIHPEGFRIFLVEPGAISGTPYGDRVQEGARRMFPDEEVGGLAERGTLGRNLEAVEVAELVYALVDGEWDWMAGRPIPFSGGYQGG